MLPGDLCSTIIITNTVLGTITNISQYWSITIISNINTRQFTHWSLLLWSRLCSCTVPAELIHSFIL